MGSEGGLGLGIETRSMVVGRVMPVLGPSAERAIGEFFSVGKRPGLSIEKGLFLFFYMAKPGPDAGGKRRGLSVIGCGAGPHGPHPDQEYD